MPLVIQPFREEHEPAVQSFNQRLRAATGDPNLVFYPRSTPSWLPKTQGSDSYNEYFVALEDGQVHGAYALKREKFFLHGRGDYAVACYHHPLSEGIVDRKYSTVGSLLLRDALRREPMLYALGMDGFDRPLPQMLKAMGWRLHLIPFYFHVVHPYRFLRQMHTVRQSPWRRWLMDLGAFSGAGWAAIHLAQTLKRSGHSRSFQAIEIEHFSEETDALWNNAKDCYRMTSVRDRKTLTRIYPAGDHALTKLSVTSGGKLLGWAVVGERRRDAKFGDLRVGSIVDCWARPEDATAVILAATQSLTAKGMDLIVNNPNHAAWGRALNDCGFFQAESNFIFAVSKKHSELLAQGDWSEFHITRANGDGLPANF